MKNRRKYEILVWLFIALLTAFIAYSNIKDSLKPIDHFPFLKGEVTQIGICEIESTVLVKGFHKRVKSENLCFTLDGKAEFRVFKTSRDYASILQQINNGDTIEIRFDNDGIEEDERFIAVEIYKGEDDIYTFNQWKAQMNLDNLLLVMATLIFLVFGNIRHRRYLRDKNG